VFNGRQQEPCESFDTFVGDLRRLVHNCEYGTVEESAIRDRFILGIRDDATRKKLLHSRKLDLTKAIDICRSLEATTRQLRAISTPDEVHSMTRSSVSRSKSSNHRGGWSSRAATLGPQQRSGGSCPTNEYRKPPLSSDQVCCRYCDRTQEKSKTSCPAYNSTCKRCGTRNHWAVVCKEVDRT